MNITIRKATIEDCRFIAWGICTALHRNPEEEDLEFISSKICAREDVLYSYRNSIIAFDGDIPVGLCLAYDGNGYHEIMLRTFKIFADKDNNNNKDSEVYSSKEYTTNTEDICSTKNTINTEDCCSTENNINTENTCDSSQSDDPIDIEHFEDETKAGEYYIDSLAVLPSYRNKGIGTMLMKSQMEYGKSLGINMATLLVDPENPDAQGVYRKLGFSYLEDCFAFGQVFWKWSKSL